MKNYITTLLLILLFSISCVAQHPKQTYTTKYALDFNIAADSTIAYQWLMNGAYNYYSMAVAFPDGNLLQIANIYFPEDFNTTDRLRTEYGQRILLPLHKEKNGKISFGSKGENIDTRSYITIDGINREEKMLFSKTINFHTDTLLTTVSANIPLTGVELLNVKIHVKGEKDKMATIIFCKLDVFIGEQHIDEFPIRELPPIPRDIETEAIAINLNSNNGFDKIKELKSSKIIGLGESLHGSGVVNKLAHKIIMQLVEKQNCKLVILEEHFEKFLPYNRYILDEDSVLDEAYSEDLHLMSLLESLKKYNSEKPFRDKVQIFGMDYNSALSSNQNTLIDIFDYVCSLNSSIEAEELDQFALLLINQDWQGAISFLSNNRLQMEKFFPFGEYENIVHTLNVSKNIGLDPIERHVKRDSIMFVNSKFLIDRFSTEDTKVIIYGHSGHINPVSTYTGTPSVPFGSFMKKEYSYDYSTLSILVGEGYNMAVKTTAIEPWTFTKDSLFTPPIGSMEYYLNSLEKDLLYLPLVPVFDRLVLSRSKTNRHLPSEFYPFNLYQRYDGVFFIKNIESSREQKKEISLDEYRKKYNDKVRKREKISKEIKKRLKKNN